MIKRHLKPQVQTALIIAEIYIFANIWTYNNCTAEGLPAFLGLSALFATIAVILGKWGSWNK